MNSLLFSLGIRSPTHHKPSITILNSHTVESSSIKIPNPQYKSQSVPVIENPNLLSRREALGIGFSFGILQFLSQPHPASADESASCEFTVTPSGLAYCDQVVGYGPQAVKGQLIKVFGDSYFQNFSEWHSHSVYSEIHSSQVSYLE